MSAGGTQLRFDDGKDAGALRTIGEVAAALGIRQHVLRYWEQQFPMLRPLKRSGGRRYYRVEDVAMVEAINRLVNREGYTLKGARLALEKGVVGVTGTAVPSPDPAPVPAPTAPTAQHDSLPAAIMLPRLRAIRDRLAGALAA